MKTTVDLPDDLLLAAKQYAVSHRTTLRELFSSALARELGQVNRSKDPISELPDRSVGDSTANGYWLDDWQSSKAEIRSARESKS